MIIESVLNLLKTVLLTVFNVLPNIPTIPQSLQDNINTFLNTIFDNLGLIGCFVDINTFKIVIPIVIIILNFKHIYFITLFILKKIPCLNIG